MVLMIKADDSVSYIMANNLNIPVTTRTLIPGHDHSAELAEIAYKIQQLSLQGLSWEQEDIKRAELRSEYNHIKALPSVPDQWEDIPDGKTYSSVWEGLSIPERGAWLASKGITVFASKQSVTVALIRFSTGQHGVKFTKKL
jgi:hypothetical protein